MIANIITMDKKDKKSEVPICPPMSGANVVDVAKGMMGGTSGKIYAVIMAGMGCMWIARRSGAASNVEVMYMDASSWDSELQTYLNFIKDHSKV